MLACLPMVCQSTRPTGESGRTARDTDAKSWLRRGLRRAKRCLGGVLGGWVVVYVCVYVYPWGGVAGRWVCTPSWRCISFACGTCVEADKTIPSGPEPSCLAARCSLPVMSAG